MACKRSAFFANKIATLTLRTIAALQRPFPQPRLLSFAENAVRNHRMTTRTATGPGSPVRTRPSTTSGTWTSRRRTAAGKAARLATPAAASVREHLSSSFALPFLVWFHCLSVPGAVHRSQQATSSATVRWPAVTTAVRLLACLAPALYTCQRSSTLA